MLSQIRMTYWIQRGRAEVKTQNLLKIPRRSIQNAIDGSVAKKSMPFKNTELDYFRPLYVRCDNEEKKKVWVCLFACVILRAIHLEFVGDPATEQFLVALRGFIARQGKPDESMSGNAAHFKLAKSAIDNAWENYERSKSTIIRL